MIKRTKILGLAIVVGLTSMGSYADVNAKERYKYIRCTETNASNLIDNKGEKGELIEKLRYDAEHRKTKLPQNIEKKLNEIGVFDSEIEQMDSETIKNIKESINTQVSVLYYGDENKEMKQKEIDSIVKEKIEKGEYDYKEEESLLSNILTKIGCKSVDVKAATKVKSAQDVDYSPSKAVKSVMICTQTENKGKISVSYTATWLKEAYYREKDVLGVNIKEANYDKSSLECSHKATHTWTRTVYLDKQAFKTNKKEELSTNPTSKNTGVTGFTYTVNLFGNRKKMNYLGVSNEKYTNETISIKFTCKPSSGKNVVFASDYYHWESNSSVSPSISISAGGISVGISNGSNNHYHKLDGNNYIDFVQHKK